LLSLLLPALGAALLFTRAAPLAGLLLIVGGMPIAVAAWLALDAPVNRRHLAAISGR
jgi:hypothetical protein